VLFNITDFAVGESYFHVFEVEDCLHSQSGHLERRSETGRHLIDGLAKGYGRRRGIGWRGRRRNVGHWSRNWNRCLNSLRRWWDPLPNKLSGWTYRPVLVQLVPLNFEVPDRKVRVRYFYRQSDPISIDDELAWILHATRKA
jgi:hypothetical protein